MRSFETDDPLTLAMAPPKDETPEERAVREYAEEQARKISEEIDEQLRREREAERRKKRPVRLLLLGQSESGKTATLKNFQLTYARREWMAERAAWRSVIFLNLVRNINSIVQEMAKEMAASSSSPPADNSDDSSLSGDDSYTSYPTNTSSSSSKSRGGGRSSALKWKERHRVLQLRLAPLRRVQADLERRLGSASTEPPPATGVAAAPFSDIGNRVRPRQQEFAINSNNGWKSVLDKARALRTRGGSVDFRNKQRDEDDEIADVIAGCREYMKDLWEDPVVRDMLSKRKSRIEDSPGFFLNDVDRIANTDYSPSDNDVIRARLRTLGVQEYRFVFEHGHSVGQEWRLYDVGGARSSRAAWYPYFDDVDAIIFLAPISCFDEKLAEDRRVNRLEDSYLLWRSVCSCKLLSRTQIILFLNKCDLLQAKLMRGIRIKDSVPSFGDRKNEVGVVAKYFQQHFKEIMKQSSPVQRTFYVHLTSVVDTRSTAATLGLVEESILRDHLRRADLM